ncbi:MAG: hypothetical protein LBL86_09055 [Coriobacteriales bacterium]|jgi:hypothetical protein|nr:hypothetical protein [Coriobacteriales bacterium]
MDTPTRTDNSNRELQGLLGLDPVPFDEGRIKQQVLDRLGNATEAVPRRQRRMPRRLTVALVAAAVLAVGIPSAYAVGNLIANMGEGGIGFFEVAAPAEKDVNKPTYYAAMQADLEKANAPVGQTLAFDGGTVTLDTLAVDDNFLNAFLTIRYDRPIDGAALGSEDNMPEWIGLQVLAPELACSVDGKEITAHTNTSGGAGGGDFERDPYYIDERTVGVMVHKVLATELPDVFDLEIRLFGDTVVVADSPAIRHANVDGGFAVTVDKGAPSALTRTVEPGTYRFEAADGPRELAIDRISFSPFGVVASIQTASLDGTGGIDAFMIADDKGNTAIPQLRGGTIRAIDAPDADVPESYLFELVGLDPQAQSVTVTPIIDARRGTDPPERRSYDLSQVGTQVPDSALGGLTVVSHEVAQGTVTIKLKPYGYLSGSSLTNGTGEFVLEDAESLTFTAEKRLGIVTSWYDRGENLIVLSTHYYAATNEELAQATTYSYCYYTDGLTADEANALTLPIG